MRTPITKPDIQNVQIDEIASDAVIDEAYTWLCTRRQKKQHNADIWDLRWRWTSEKSQLQNTLLKGDYRLSPLNWFLSEEGDLIELYSARDALILTF